VQEAHLGAVPHARQVLLAVGVSHELTTASQPPSRVYDMFISDKKKLRPIKSPKCKSVEKLYMTKDSFTHLFYRQPIYLLTYRYLLTDLFICRDIVQNKIETKT